MNGKQEDIVDEDVLEEIIKEGLIQRFEYTYEMAWNVMKDYALYQGYSEIGGSRAKGNYRKDSDIDISLVGSNLNLNIILRIENELDDLLLPYHIDVSIFEKIENPDLQ